MKHALSAAVLWLTSCGVFAASGATLAPACDPAAQVQTLHEHAFVPIGGIQQWVTIEARIAPGR